MKERWLIIAGAAGIIAIFIIGVISIQRQNQYNESAPKEPEAAVTQAAGVVLTGTDDLANILLSSQFVAVRTNLVAHIQGTYPKAKSASVSQTHVNNDGSISLSLHIPAYGKDLEVIVIRGTEGTVSIKIPTDNYNSGAIQVYNGARQ